MKTVFEWRIEVWHSTILMQVTHMSLLPGRDDGFRTEHIEIIFGTELFINSPVLCLPYEHNTCNGKLVTKDFGTPEKAQQFLANVRSAVRQYVKSCFPADRVVVESDGHTDTFLVTNDGEVLDSGAEEL